MRLNRDTHLTEVCENTSCPAEENLHSGLGAARKVPQHCHVIILLIAVHLAREAQARRR